MITLKVPALADHLIVRLAGNPAEIRAANRLVCRAYREQGYWRGDETELDDNPYLHLPTRRIFVVVNGTEVIGTASIILDSGSGIPADTFQPQASAQLRRHGETLAEISALAIDRRAPHSRTLIHYLVAFIFQYSFYYAAVDRFVVVCTPKHGRFYEQSYGFQRVETIAFYDYVKIEAQMLTMALVEGYTATREHYRAPALNRSFFHFLYRDEHPCLEFPPCAQMRRRRQLEWMAYAPRSLPAAM